MAIHYRFLFFRSLFVSFSSVERNMTTKRFSNIFLNENQMQLKLLITCTFNVRRTGIQNRVTSDWEVPPPPPLQATPTQGDSTCYVMELHLVPFPQPHDTCITSKTAQLGAENMWRKPMSRQHAPCADDCEPWCMFRADDVRGILKLNIYPYI